MAKTVARNIKLIMQGKDVSGLHNNATLSLSAEAPEVTVFGNTTRQRLGGGIRDFELGLDGFFDTAASQADALYSELLAGSNLTLICPVGYGASNPAYLTTGVVSQYESAFALADAATVTAAISGCSYWRGKSLGYISDSAGSTTGCTVDFAAADGNTVQYQVHYLTMPTSISACIQHSTDDVTYATAEVLSTVTASGVAHSGSLTSANRYRRVRYAYVGGAGALVAAISGSSI